MVVYVFLLVCFLCVDKMLSNCFLPEEFSISAIFFGWGGYHLSLVNHKNVKFKTISLNVRGIYAFFWKKKKSAEIENQWQKYLCNPNLKFVTQQNTSPLFQLCLHVIEHKYKKLLPLHVRRCTAIHPNPKTKNISAL